MAYTLLEIRSAIIEGDIYTIDIHKIKTRVKHRDTKHRHSYRSKLQSIIEIYNRHFQRSKQQSYLEPITVLTKPTRQAVCAINKSIFLRCLCLYPKSQVMQSHRHLSNIDCLMVHTACLVCFISTVNERSKQRENALEDVALVAGT